MNENVLKDGLDLGTDTEILEKESGQQTCTAWFNGTDTGLKWSNVTATDIGVYYLQEEPKNNTQKVFRYTLLIDVADRPAIRCQQKPPDDFHFPKESYDAFEASCEVRGTPPLTTWLLSQGCKSPSNCYKADIILVEVSADFYDTREFISTTNISSIYTLFARNKHGKSKWVVWMNVSDVANGFDLQYSPEKLITGNSVTLNCSASPFRFGKISSIEWFYNNSADKSKSLRSQPHVAIRRFETKFSQVSELRMEYTNVSNSGTYGCRIIGSQNQGDNIIRKSLQFLDTEKRR